MFLYFSAASLTTEDTSVFGFVDPIRASLETVEKYTDQAFAGSRAGSLWYKAFSFRSFNFVESASFARLAKAASVGAFLTAFGFGLAAFFFDFPATFFFGAAFFVAVLLFAVVVRVCLTVDLVAVANDLRNEVLKAEVPFVSCCDSLLLNETRWTR